MSCTKFFCTVDGVAIEIGCKFVRQQALSENFPWLSDTFKVGATLWTWGYCQHGRLGDNNVISRSSPVQTAALGTNWRCVSSGFVHVLATKTDGTLWTWGYNVDGQVGDLSRTPRSSPVQVVGLATNWRHVDAGQAHSLAIKTDGTLWGWGWNGWGQLATNTLANQSSPVQTISAGTNWKQVAGGCRNTASIKTDGSLWQWGTNANGQLGNNNLIARSSPVQTISAGTNWRAVRTSGYHSLSIKTDGTLWGMGKNYGYELGNGIDYVDRSSPVQTAGSRTNWKQVSVICRRSGGITTAGSLLLWGDGGQTGALNGSLSSRYNASPRKPFFDGCFICIEIGRDQSSVIAQDGTLWSWGTMTDGGLGNNRGCSIPWIQTSPVQTIAGGNNWRTLSLGGPNMVIAIREEDG